MPQTCQAYNAFRAPVALTQLFLQSTPVPLVRSFSTSNRPRAIADASATSIEDASRQGQDGKVAMDPRVDAESLSRTLEAHRRANRESIIRRTFSSEPGDHGAKSSTVSPVAPRVKVSKPPSGYQFKAHSQERKRHHNNTYDPHQGSKSAFGMDFRGLRNTHKDKHQPLMYNGVDLRPLLGRGLETSKTVWPWTGGADPGLDEHQRLDYEIQKFHEWIVPTPLENTARQEVIRDVRNIIQDELGDDHSTELFGSERCGIALATSDIDIRITHGSLQQSGPKPPRPQSRKLNFMALKRLFKRVKQSHDYRETTVLHARYPLVAFTHGKSGIKVQVVACNDTTKSRNTMLQYMDTYPGLREVYTLVKASFDVRGISDVFHGGLGSYSLFMFLVASLKLTEGQPVEQRSLSKNFIDFLEFRNIIDYSKQGISVDPPGVFQKKPNVNPPGAEPSTKSFAHEDPIVRGRHRLAVIDPIQPYLLCLQDPADCLNDLGHKAYGIKHIFASMEGMRGRLRTQLNTYLAYDAQHRSEISLLYPIVGDIEALYSHRRAKIAKFGAELAQSIGEAVDSTVNESPEAPQPPQPPPQAAAPESAIEGR